MRRRGIVAFLLVSAAPAHAQVSGTASSASSPTASIPFRVPSVDMQKGMHGNDERISVKNMRFGVRYLYDVLRYAQ